MKKVILSAALASSATIALPIDWHGELQFDTNKIQDFRKIDSTVDNSASTTGTQEIPLAGGSLSSASFQSYIFKLSPEIIINDSTTVKAEFTTGSGYGGRFGDSSTKRDASTGDPRFTTGLYTFDTVRDNNLNVTQLYANFYADTATYTVGRHAAHWALGALHNNGEDKSSRHSTIRDGVTVDLKIGNFNLDLYYSKISSADNLTKSGRIKESGVSILYNNLDREFAFGILYAKNKSSSDATLVSDITNTNLGKTDVKITDIYLKKSWDKFTTEIEVPLMSGEIGDVYSTTSNEDTKYKAKAFLIHNTYNLNNNHTLNLNFGQIGGDDGLENSYNALYLHPNYQVANLLFRYNLYAVSDTAQNIYDSYVTNATFVKFAHTYTTTKWSWTNSFVWAKADESAQAGSDAYNHSTSKKFTATFSQEDDLGIELDSNFNYMWNSSVTLGGNFGYLLTGDYWGYNDSATPNEAKDTYILQAFANIKF